MKGPFYEQTNHVDKRQQPKKISMTNLIGRPTNVVCLSIELWSQPIGGRPIEIILFISHARTAPRFILWSL